MALVATSGFETLATLAPEIILIAALSGIIGLGLGDTLYMYEMKSIGVSTAVPLAATYPPFQFIVGVSARRARLSAGYRWHNGDLTWHLASK